MQRLLGCRGGDDGNGKNVVSVVVVSNKKELLTVECQRGQISCAVGVECAELFVSQRGKTENVGIACGRVCSRAVVTGRP